MNGNAENKTKIEKAERNKRNIEKSKWEQKN